MAKIYIAFIQEDEEAARKMAAYFRQHSHKINGSVVTVSWERTALAIEQCDLFIYMISPAAIQSPLWKQQLDEAMRLKKDVQGIIIKKIDTVFPDRGYRYTLDMVHGISSRQLLTIHHSLQPHLKTQTHTRSIAPPRGRPMWLYAVAIIVLILVGTFIYIQVSGAPANEDKTASRAGAEANPTISPRPNSHLSVQLTEINPPIEIQLNEAAGWQVVTDDTTIPNGTRLRTNDFGRVTLLLPNGDQIIVKPTSDIQIMNIVEINDQWQVKLQLFAGAIEQHTEDLTTDYTVTTPRLILNPTSRRYEVLIENDTTTILQVHAGTVAVSNENNQLTVAAGNELVLPANNRFFDVHPIGETARITVTPIPSATLIPSITPENSPTSSLTPTPTPTYTATSTATTSPTPTIFAPPITLFPRTATATP